MTVEDNQRKHYGMSFTIEKGNTLRGFEYSLGKAFGEFRDAYREEVDVGKLQIVGVRLKDGQLSFIFVEGDV